MTLTPFRMNTYQKQWGEGLGRHSRKNVCPACPELLGQQRRYPGISLPARRRVPVRAPRDHFRIARRSGGTNVRFLRMPVSGETGRMRRVTGRPEEDDDNAEDR